MTIEESEEIANAAEEVKNESAVEERSEGANEEMSNGTDEPNSTKDKWKPLLLVSIIIAVLIISQIFGIAELLGDTQDWIDSLGFWGPVIFAIIYIGAVVATFPASILTIIAGTLFGTLVGVIVVSVASTTGASISFLIGRYFARDATARWLGQSDMFGRLEMMTEEHGAIIVALVRLVPLFPFNLVNYGFGLTKIPFKTYVFYSWLCMLPFTIIFVAGADIAMSLSEGEVPWLLIMVVAIIGVILSVVVKHAKQLIEEKEQECLEKFGTKKC